MSFASKIAAVLNSAGILNPALGGAPAGAVLPYAGTAAPTGWLFCYGQDVSRTTYAGLFAAVGTTYGAGDGSTTFALPDMRERIPAGKGDMGGATANRIQRTKVVTLTAGSAVVTGIVSTANLHAGMSVMHADVPQGTTILSIDSVSQITMSANATGSSSGGTARFGVLDANALGGNGGAAHHVLAATEMPSHAHTGTINNAGAHTHTGGATSSLQGTTENNAGATASGTTGSAGDHTHTMTINNTGGGNAHANVQPTIILNYIIKT